MKAEKLERIENEMRINQRETKKKGKRRRWWR
jgi:hypothetical protein